MQKPEPIQPKVAEQPKPQPVEKPLPIKEEPKPEPVHEVPISLLDQPEEPAPEIVLSKDVLYIKGTKQEESFVISDDLMIDIMVVAKKELKKIFLNDWNNLKRLIAHPQLGKMVTILVDGRPFVASDKVLIVEYQFPSNAEKANLIENQENMQNVVQSAFGKKMFVFGVSRSECIRWQQSYLNRQQIKTLPKADSVNIEFEGE